MLDKKESVIETLDSIKKLYLKLVLLKQYEKEAYIESNYEYIYELTENERTIIDDINTLMKYIVPDLLFLKRDSIVKIKMMEIDRLKETVISDSLEMRNSLERGIEKTKKKIENINVFPKASSSAVPHIVNIRA